MEGYVRGSKHRQDLAFWQAWHSGIFAQMRFDAAKKAFREHFSEAPSEKSQNAQAIAFFMGLKAKGVPIEITRTKH